MTVSEFISQWNDASPCVEVHTSGSTGKPKVITVEKSRMAASAVTTCSFLGLKKGDTALLCMSVDFIAGKMMVVRSQVCGLKLIVVEPSGHPLKGLTGSLDFVAMVPMQVYNSLQVDEERERLCKIAHLIIGGGALDKSLERELSGFPGSIWSTYGMTETLSHIALRRINGPEASLWYTPLDGVTIGVNGYGCLTIDAPRVHEGLLVTNDIAELSPDGKRFKILGRKDNVICSGGLKMHIEEMEESLRQHLSVPFMITKRTDDKFGEAVVLLYTEGRPGDIKAVCDSVLQRYERPKDYLKVDSLPMTGNGKPSRVEAERIAEERLRRY